MPDIRQNSRLMPHIMLHVKIFSSIGLIIIYPSIAAETIVQSNIDSHRRAMFLLPVFYIKLFRFLKSLSSLFPFHKH
jgi:hypothetical protein